MAFSVIEGFLWSLAKPPSRQERNTGKKIAGRLNRFLVGFKISNIFV